MLSEDLVEEIDLLLRFDLSSTQLGLKIHSSAESNVIAAAERLFEKGLTSQVDGGYLTELGRESAEYLQRATTILRSKPAVTADS
ncbi:TIGR02647 family protein [Agaribacterium haliotis]|uniref:TIGR02647 family protein n=1 Tax=Agaribacterium haliotis TaxID=2013869 RepID=UPI000BB5306C|nr:TIGR02647 family protein [Agaribacterium haliotis]